MIAVPLLATHAGAVIPILAVNRYSYQAIRTLAKLEVATLASHAEAFASHAGFFCDSVLLNAMDPSSHEYKSDLHVASEKRPPG